jgi:DNA-binding MarR family transcriptional regulator
MADAKPSAKPIAEKLPVQAEQRLRLEAFLPYRLNLLAAETSQGLARLYSRRFGLSIPEWRVIATLGEFTTATAKAIGLHSHMHKTKVSRAVADLLRRGLLRRQVNKADLREAKLTLTGEGRRVYEEIVPLALTYQARLVADMSELERHAIDKAIHVLTLRSKKLLAEILEEG